MTTANVVHAINALLDWLSLAAKTPENERLATALRELKGHALDKLNTEISD